MKGLVRALFTALTLAISGVTPSVQAAGTGPSHVTTAKQPDGSYKYLVNGQPQVFIGMGYDPMYRFLPSEQRAANYRRDFQLLKKAGVNTITGWDADKGYEQDKFDELTLNLANEYGIGVVMPLNLPPEADYRDPNVVADLMAQGKAKVERFKDNPALRMWGVGNEVYWEMDPDMYPAFSQAYLQIADMFHQLDPNHPVIYREAEDAYVPIIADSLRRSGDMRPWLLYGMNVYSKDLRPILSAWPDYGLDRPVFVSEFGAEGDTPAQRAQGYLDMWRAIRQYPKFVMGGAPYVWTTQGPEPTDKIWGLMDTQSKPVDQTFALLSVAWRTEPTANH
ncbi:MAG TPA: glycoside hydrolase family 2 TIM barrel-domain containing protein [Chloroflexota bacterium]|jgi:beta-galactosidase/beta-glucuronidase